LLAVPAEENAVMTKVHERAVASVSVLCLGEFDPAIVPVRATEDIGMLVVNPKPLIHWPGPHEAS
jgi:hypothetical protein